LLQHYYVSEEGAVMESEEVKCVFLLLNVRNLAR